jgi:hypothetical protein
MIRQFRLAAKDDSGMILGIVLIGLTIIGTVLGSALMMTQISMEAKGQSLEHLKTKNVVAQQSANNLRDLTLLEEVAVDLNNSSNSSNCGVPSDLDDTHITCTVTQDSNPKNNRVVIEFKDHNGHKSTRIFTVPNGSDHNDSESNSD